MNAGGAEYTYSLPGFCFNTRDDGKRYNFCVQVWN